MARLRQVKNQPQQKLKDRRSRTSAESFVPVPHESLHIVPWVSSEEWEQVCTLFNSDQLDTVISEISVWRQRVPALPVGVEATLFLIQAILYDENSQHSVEFSDVGASNDFSEDHSRSLYSLAVIRYLNHVSHLATKEMGGVASIPMFQLASQVSVPEWIVNLRHEASHGTSLPSLETLRLAADFIKTWLKEHYWVDLNSPSSEQSSILTVTRDVNDVFSRTSDYLSAFIACRVYKLRRKDVVTDPQIIQLISKSSTSSSVKTKVALAVLKTKIVSLLETESAIMCAVVAEEMVPHPEFYMEFLSLFNAESSFDQLTLIWNPIIKLLEAKGKLVSVCSNLAEMHVNQESNDSLRNLSALWINKILELLEISENNFSQRLSKVLEIVMKNPTSHTGLFIERLLKLLGRRLGAEKVYKLELLTKIWIEDPSNTGKVRKRTIRDRSDNYFTIDDVLSKTDRPDSIKRTKLNKDNVENWEPDRRGYGACRDGDKFWQKTPCGTVLDS